MATNLLDLYAKISLDDTEFSAGVDRAASRFGALGNTFTGISNVGKSAFKAVGVAVTAGGAALGAFVKSSVDTGMTFDKSMSQVAATMGYSVDEINKSGSEANKTFNNLRNAAIEYGETTAFTSTQASEALNYMALAGYDAETAIATLPNVLNLAAAGGLDLGYASDMITDSQTALGLTLEETNVLMDQMAVTASKSNTSVGQLGEAILTVGGTAQYMAGGTEELNSVLGVLADNGIKGSEAGTHLRNMILSLSSPTDAGAAALERLGVSIFDGEGKMRSFTDIFPELNSAMSGLTEEQKLQALSDIFNVRDIASANALLGTTAERWDELGGYIEDADGAMATMAATQLDNLAGDVTILNSAMDGLKIAISDEVTPSLRKFAQQGTKYVGRVKKALTDKGWEGALTEVSKILSEMVSAFISYLPQIANVALQMIGVFIDGIASNSSGIIEAGGMILDNIVSGLGQISEKIMPVLSQFVPLIINYFLTYKAQMFQIGLDILTAIIQGIADNIGNIGQSAISIINGLVSNLQKNIPVIVEAGVQMLVALLQNLPEILSMLGQAALTIITTLATSLMNAWNEHSGEILTALSEIWDLIVQYATQVWDAFVSWLAGIWTSIKEKASEIWNGIVEVISSVWEWIKSVVSTAVNAVATTVSNVWNSIKETAATIWEAIKTAIGTAWEAIKLAVSTAIYQVASTLQNVWNNIKQTVSTVWDSVKKAIANTWNTIKTTVSTAIYQVASTLQNVWNNIKQTVSTIWDAIKTAISTAWAAIKLAVSTAIYQVAATLQNTWNNIKETVSNIWEAIKTAISTAWEAIKLAVSTAIYQVAATLSNVWNNITSTVSTVWETVKTTISTAWTNIKTSVTTAINTVQTKISSIWTSIKTKTSETWNAVKEAIAKPIRQAKNTVKNVIDKIKGFFDFDWSLPKLKLPHISITGKFSLAPPSVPKFSISWYRKAMNNAMLLDNPTIFGMVDGQFLGAGEAGKEVISGADTLMGMIQSAVRSVLTGGGSGFSVNITQNIYSQAQTAADLMLEARWEAERAVLMNV